MRPPEFADAERTHAAALVNLILWLLFVAALLTAPLFFVGESFSQTHLVRVLLSNGGTALGALGLLALLRRGRVELVAQLVSWGLFALISALSATNGEPIHVNVINFLLVVVIAHRLLSRAGFYAIAFSCAAAMAAIAIQQTFAATGTEPVFERATESLVQFLPTFLVIVLVLRLDRRRA
jgi:hypothetical protein